MCSASNCLITSFSFLTFDLKLVWTRSSVRICCLTFRSGCSFVAGCSQRSSLQHRAARKVCPRFLPYSYMIVDHRSDPLVPAGPGGIFRSGFRIAIVYDNDVPGLSHTSRRVVSFFLSSTKLQLPAGSCIHSWTSLGESDQIYSCDFLCSLFHLFQNLCWIIRSVQHDSYGKLLFRDTLSNY